MDTTDIKLDVKTREIAIQWPGTDKYIKYREDKALSPASPAFVNQTEDKKLLEEHNNQHQAFQSLLQQLWQFRSQWINREIDDIKFAEKASKELRKLREYLPSQADQDQAASLCKYLDRHLENLSKADKEYKMSGLEKYQQMMEERKGLLRNVVDETEKFIKKLYEQQQTFRKNAR